MSLEIHTDFAQQYLLAPCPEDWVPANHPARFIRDFVRIILKHPASGFPARLSEEGRPSYSPEMLLGVWLYGYMTRVRTSRRLEQACRDQMPFIWLTGTLVPDHNTLWRFYQGHRPGLKKLFNHVVQVARKAGLIGMELHACDGTKMKAKSSNRTGSHRKSLVADAADLDALIEIAMQELEAMEAKETGGAPFQMPAALVDATHRRAVIASALASLDEHERNHYHPLEPEARMQQVGSERTFGYNAQAVIDARHGIIVAETVVTDENDQRCLVPMMEAVKANLGANATDTVADKGYATSQAFGELQEKGLEATVPLTRSMSGEAVGPYAASEFSYEKELDVMICPEQQQLPFRRLSKSKAGYQVREYQCNRGATCPVRSQCSSSKQGRVVVLNPFLPAIEKQRERYHDPIHKRAYRLRKQLIERVFAQIKEHEGFRRYTMRGLENVQTQWSVLMTTFNLKKLYLLWRDNQFMLPSTGS